MTGNSSSLKARSLLAEKRRRKVARALANSTVVKRTGGGLRTLFRAAVCYLVSTSLVAAQVASVLPTGGSVASGAASIAASNANALTIAQTSRNAVINWSSFSIGAGNTVTFQQPDAGSAVLNRVTGNATSSIAGNLNANGQVYLVNPNGIAITKTGIVNVGSGFIASTLGISDQDFNAGKLNFKGNGASASVSNDGQINLGRNGFVALLGGGISNAGTISAPLGKVGLGSGEQATLDLNGGNFLQVAVPTSALTADGQKLIDVAGTITASGGRVEVKAATAQQAMRGVVNVTGEISASSSYKKGGSIILDSGAGGALAVSGKVTASSSKAQGGSIALGGRSIDLAKATLDASGATGGGSILIGGAGKGEAIAGVTMATDVSVDADTRIEASATESGDGGTVVLWANNRMDYAGSINAQALGASGNGGEAEVSGSSLIYHGLVSLRSVNGKNGTLLLDPGDLTISTRANGSTNADGSSNINVDSLVSSLQAGASVTITAVSSGSQAGNITVENSIIWNTSTVLTLRAAGTIALNASITSSHSDGSLTLIGTGVTGAGAISAAGVGCVCFLISGASTYAGVISGGGALVKSGAGTLTLTGNNTHTGFTQINGGMLVIGGQGQLGSGKYAGSIANFSKFEYSSSADQIFSGVISDSGTLTKSGSGSLTLTGINTYTGNTLINGGTLSVGNASALGTGTVLFGGGTLQYGAGITTDFSSRFSQSIPGQKYSIDTNGNNVTFASTILSNLGTFTKSGSGTLTLTGAAIYNGDTTINGGILQIDGNGSLRSRSLSARIYAGAITIASGAAFQYSSTPDQELTGVISGAGILIKDTGAGTLTLSGANTYTGPTMVSAGRLTAGSTSAFGSNSAVILSAGATLDLNGFSNSIGSLAGTGGTVTNSNASLLATLTVGGNNASTSFSGLINDVFGTQPVIVTSTLSLVKTGKGTFSITTTGSATPSSEVTVIAPAGGKWSGTPGLTLNGVSVSSGVASNGLKLTLNPNGTNSLTFGSGVPAWTVTFNDGHTETFNSSLHSTGFAFTGNVTITIPTGTTVTESGIYPDFVQRQWLLCGRDQRRRSEWRYGREARSFRRHRNPDGHQHLHGRDDNRCRNAADRRRGPAQFWQLCRGDSKTQNF